MAWYNDGNWSGFGVNKMGTIIYQLMMALHERWAIVHPDWSTDRPIGSRDQYYLPYYSATKYPDELTDEGDLDGLMLDPSYYDEQMILYDLRNNVGWLLHPWNPGRKGMFVSRSSPYSSNLGLAQALSAGSYGSTWLPVINHPRLDERYWLQLKEVIEQMDHVVWDIRPPAYDSDPNLVNNSTYSDYDGDWADRDDNSGNPDDISVVNAAARGPAFGAGFYDGATTFDDQYWVLDWSTTDLPTSYVQGELKQGIYTIAEVSQDLDYAVVSATFDGTTYTPDTGTVGTATTIDKGTTWPNVGTDTTVSFTPGALSDGSPPNADQENSHYAYVRMDYYSPYIISGTRCVTDISGEMTYG